MGEIFGESPRPWTFVLGSPLHENEQELVNSLPGTVEIASNIGNVAQGNFDAAVVFGDISGIASHLMVINVGGSGVADGIPGRGERFYTRDPRGNSGLLSIEADNAPEGISSVELRALADHVKKKRPHALIRSVSNNVTSDIGIKPIIREKDGAACVGWWERPRGRGLSEFWWFPRAAPGLALWRSALYSRWHKVAPQAFPVSQQDWTRSPNWITVPEVEAIQELERHRRETEEIIELRRQEAANLEQEVERVTAEVNSTTRLLLTAQGKPLVGAVASVLSGLGFTVIDSDEEKEEGAYLLEDLKVMHEDWISLAEVRGYSKGAKTSDLQRIERAVRHYERGHGVLPSARWYVVNHNLKANPDSRPDVLSGATEDIEVFAEEHGLVIDTRDLYRVVKEVKEGRLSADRARERLMTSSGVFSFPPALDGDQTSTPGGVDDQT
ncbi:hypothetical protein [Streptomyces canus]|uniref:hypothetical protein n=1 Tax=Streptomyces canus TaxID=58343 RepID=UPI0030DEE6BB